MESDRYVGWGEAPAVAQWFCPSCGEASNVEAWEEREVYCEDCGSHDGRKCPQCGEVFDYVWGARQIADATNKALATK